LLHVVRLTWPHVGVHALLLWQVLRRVHEEELQCRLADPASSSFHSRCHCQFAFDFAFNTSLRGPIGTKCLPCPTIPFNAPPFLPPSAGCRWRSAAAAATRQKPAGRWQNGQRTVG
jgi:hypothetical protein